MAPSASSAAHDSLIVCQPALEDRQIRALSRSARPAVTRNSKTINELLGCTLIEHLCDRLTEAGRLRDDITTQTQPDGANGAG